MTITSMTLFYSLQVDSTYNLLAPWTAALEV